MSKKKDSSVPFTFDSLSEDDKKELQMCNKRESIVITKHNDECYLTIYYLGDSDKNWKTISEESFGGSSINFNLKVPEKVAKTIW